MGRDKTPSFVPDEADLRQALDRNEFAVYYQPIIELATGRLTAVEALVRWLHPAHGMLWAGSFIGIAESCGFSVPISEGVLRSACMQAQAWQAQGFDLPTVSFNPAIGQFRPKHLSSFLQMVLTETGLDPRFLAIELHEDHMPDPAVAVVVLTELATLGIPLWIDDFGMGPSGVRYLKHFPFAVLKIDLSFVWNMDTDPRWDAIVSGLVGLAHHLRLRAVAEGVTNDAQLALLRAHGCDLIQGWRYSPPLPAAELTALLQEGRCFT